MYHFLRVPLGVWLGLRPLFSVACGYISNVGEAYKKNGA